MTVSRVRIGRVSGLVESLHASGDGYVGKISPFQPDDDGEGEDLAEAVTKAQLAAFDGGIVPESLAHQRLSELRRETVRV